MALRFFLIISLLGFSLVGFAELASADGESRVKQEEEGHPVWLTPAVSAQRINLGFGGTSANAGWETASGPELALRLYSSSNRNRTLFVGLDAREWLTVENGTSALDVYGTKLGIRLEYRLPIPLQPSIAGAWFFGDTFVDKTRSEQFVGGSGEGTLGLDVGGGWRVFFTYGVGAYSQGGGFIVFTQLPGTDTVTTQYYMLGVEWAIQSVWPSWLTMTPPHGEVQPF